MAAIAERPKQTEQPNTLVKILEEIQSASPAERISTGITASVITLFILTYADGAIKVGTQGFTDLESAATQFLMIRDLFGLSLTAFLLDQILKYRINYRRKLRGDIGPYEP